MNSIRTPCGLDKDWSWWSPDGVHMESTWSIYTLVHLESSMWSPCGLHQEGDWSGWGLGVDWMRSGRITGGLQQDSLAICGLHVDSHRISGGVRNTRSWVRWFRDAPGFTKGLGGLCRFRCCQASTDRLSHQRSSNTMFVARHTPF